MRQVHEFDLDDVTLINESRSEFIPGDVTIFRTPEEACRWLEAWWVRDREGSALTANGDRLWLLPTDRVSVRLREPHPEGEQIVRLWLAHTAADVQRARKDARPLPTALRDLVAYVGFHR